MKTYGQWGIFYVVLTAGFIHYGCRVEQEQKIGGTARAEIVVSYPAAEACFTDARVQTTEALLSCLELTTAQKWTIDAAGQVVEMISEGMGGGAVDEPENIVGDN